MKLNPPASSSDLEAAREIARRLHQRRRREDRPTPEGAVPAPAFPPPQPLSAPLHERTEPVVAPAPERAPSEPSAFDALPGFDAPARPAEAAPLEEPGPLGEETVIDVEDTTATDVPAPDALAPDPSPFDAAGDAEADDATPAPSWGDVVDACRGLAQASGALVADPSGRVFAVRGDWPEPGPDAIAAKLVAMMNRTLKDAPTRSISAPLMGMHLTAWRVPLEQGLVTVAFVAEAPVRTEVRPAIDTEIHRGAGL